MALSHSKVFCLLFQFPRVYAVFATYFAYNCDWFSVVRTFTIRPVIAAPNKNVQYCWVMGLTWLTSLSLARAVESRRMPNRVRAEVKVFTCLLLLSLQFIHGARTEHDYHFVKSFMKSDRVTKPVEQKLFWGTEALAQQLRSRSNEFSSFLYIIFIFLIYQL